MQKSHGLEYGGISQPAIAVEAVSSRPGWRRIVDAFIQAYAGLRSKE